MVVMFIWIGLYGFFIVYISKFVFEIFLFLVFDVCLVICVVIFFDKFEFVEFIGVIIF